MDSARTSLGAGSLLVRREMDEQLNDEPAGLLCSTRQSSCQGPDAGTSEEADE